MRFTPIVAILVATPPVAAQPSFDCAKAKGEAERQICDDAQLASLDRETARLFALAETGPNVDEGRLATLRTSQESWLAERDACAEAEDPALCLQDSYAGRIATLRQSYADARQDDEAGISLGPFVAECDGLDALVGVVFVNAETPVVHLAWLDREMTLPQGPSASGARYAGPVDGGEAIFWNKGDEATFELPGQPASTCQLIEPG